MTLSTPASSSPHTVACCCCCLSVLTAGLFDILAFYLLYSSFFAATPKRACDRHMCKQMLLFLFLFFFFSFSYTCVSFLGGTFIVTYVFFFSLFISNEVGHEACNGRAKKDKKKIVCNHQLCWVEMPTATLLRCCCDWWLLLLQLCQHNFNWLAMSGGCFSWGIIKLVVTRAKHLKLKIGNQHLYCNLFSI